LSIFRAEINRDGIAAAQEMQTSLLAPPIESSERRSATHSNSCRVSLVANSCDFTQSWLGLTCQDV
jgi:hypothetical protein